MKWKRVGLLFLFLLTSVGAIPLLTQHASAAIGASGWGTPNNPINAHPGYMDVPFFVIVSAPLTLQLQQAVLDLPGEVLSSQCTTVAYGSSSQSSLGTYLLTFDLSVPSSTSPGYYEAYLTVYYTNITNGNTVVESGPVTIPVKPVIYPSLQLLWGTTQSPTFARAGEGVTPITLVVTNPSEHPILNVKVNVTLPKGVFSLSGQDYICQEIPAVPAGEVVQVTEVLNVSSLSSPGNYQLKYKISFTNYLEFSYSTSGITSTSIYSLSPFNTTMVQEEATAGELTHLYLTVDSSTTGLMIKLLPDLKVLYTNFTETSISPGGRYTFCYEVLTPDTVSGNFPVLFQATLDDMGQVVNYTFLESLHVENNATPSVVDSFWGEGNQTTLAFPDEGIVPLTLLVENPLPVPLENVNVTLMSGHGISPSYPYVTVPLIGNFSVQEVTYPVDITNVSTGPVPLEYKITYGNHTVEGSFTVVVNQLSPVFAEPEVKPIPTGGYSNLTVRVVNNGSLPVQDVGAVLEVGGIEEIAYFNQTIPSLAPHSNSSFVFYFYAPPTLKMGVYPALLKVFFSEYSKVFNETYVVPLVVVTDPSLAISLSPMTVFYSSNNTVTLSVYNPLRSPVYDVQISLVSQSPLYISSPTLNVAEVPPNSTSIFTEDVVPEVPSTSTIPLEVDVSYLYDGLPYTQTEQVELFSTGNVSLQMMDVTSSVVNGSVVVSGTLLDNGNSPAKDVIVSIANYTSLYVGEVTPGNPTPFSLSLQVPPGYYHFNLTATYLNSVNNQEETSYVIAMGVSYNTQTSDSKPIDITGVGLGALIVVMIALIIYLAVKRK